MSVCLIVLYVGMLVRLGTYRTDSRSVYWIIGTNQKGELCPKQLELYGFVVVVIGLY